MAETPPADAPPLHAEHRWPVLVTVTLTLLLYIFLPDPFPFLPSWVIPILGLVTIAPLVILNPRRLGRETTWSRWIGVGFAIGLALINQVYITQIIADLVDGATDGPSILVTAFSVWVTNVIAFALVFWELDEGGPFARRFEPDRAQQDFRFPQQDGSPGTQLNWRPVFFDYMFFSLSSMMAFSPTDVMPLTLRAKALMAYESLTGFVLLALVISRSVNILA
jgi:hypothetical protein